MKTGKTFPVAPAFTTFLSLPPECSLGLGCRNCAVLCHFVLGFWTRHFDQLCFTVIVSDAKRSFLNTTWELHPVVRSQRNRKFTVRLCLLEISPTWLLKYDLNKGNSSRHVHVGREISWGLNPTKRTVGNWNAESRRDRLPQGEYFKWLFNTKLSPWKGKIIYVWHNK